MSAELIFKIECVHIYPGPALKVYITFTFIVILIYGDIIGSMNTT